MNTHLYEEIKSIEDVINEEKPKHISNKLQTEDEYTKLKNKEDKILTLLDDIHSKKNEEVDSINYFTSAPLHVIIFKTFKTIVKIGKEMTSKDDPYQMVEMLVKIENIIYFVIALVIFSILLMFISV
mgnify:CR=1 FL=1